MFLKKIDREGLKNLSIWERLAGECVRQLKKEPWRIAVASDRAAGVSVFGRWDAPEHGIVHVVDDTLAPGFFRDFKKGSIHFRIESGGNPNRIAMKT